MKIKKLITKSQEEISIGRLVVLVGPNNVGKSQVLRDIRDKFEAGKQAKITLIEEIDFEDITYDELIRSLSIEPHPTILDQQSMKGIDSALANGVNYNIRKDNLKNCFEGSPPKPNWQALIEHNVLRLKIAFLNAESRLQIASQKKFKTLLYLTKVHEAITSPLQFNRTRDLIKNREMRDYITTTLKNVPMIKTKHS